MKFIAVILSIITLLIESVSTSQCKTKARVILIVIAGLNTDFLNPKMMPTLLKYADVLGSKMQTSFPAMPLCAAQTIATGDYVRSHQIYHKEFYDLETGDLIKYGSRMYSKANVNRKYPIWAMIQKHLNCRTYCINWPGKEFGDTTPKCDSSSYIYKDREQRESFDKITDMMVEEMSNEKDPVALVMYHSVHLLQLAKKYGFSSDAVKKELRAIEEIPILLQDKLAEFDLFEYTNVIIMGSICMWPTPSLPITSPNFDSLIDSVEHIGENPLFFFKSSAEELLKSTRKQLGKNFRLDPVSNIAKKSNERPYLGFMKESSKIDTKLYMAYATNSQNNIINLTKDKYLTRYSMCEYEIGGGIKPLFMAYGPDFRPSFHKKNYFHIKDVFALIIQLLGIDKKYLNDRDSDFSAIKNVLKGFEADESERYIPWFVFPIALLIIVFCVIWTMPFKKSVRTSIEIEQQQIYNANLENRRRQYEQHRRSS